MNTLDSIRAAFDSTYARDVNERMIGAGMGRVLIDPTPNLHYVEGTGFWAGVMPMALVGIGRAFEIDLTP